MNSDKSSKSTHTWSRTFETGKGYRNGDDFRGSQYNIDLAERLLSVSSITSRIARQKNKALVWVRRECHAFIKRGGSDAYCSNTPTYSKEYRKSIKSATLGKHTENLIGIHLLIKYTGSNEINTTNINVSVS